MVRAGFRFRLDERDLRFVLNVLAASDGDEEALMQLLADPATVDSVLDQRELFDAALESVEHLSITPRFYFYLLARHAFLRAGVRDAELADYVSGVLEQFSGFRGKAPRAADASYVVDMIRMIEASPENRKFELYLAAGNRLLFLTGVFPGFIERRARRRGAPALHFYETAGRRSYASAARHPTSRAAETELFYESLAEAFPDSRLALNDLAERFIALDRQPPGLIPGA